MHPGVDLGYLPGFLSELDPRPAKEQFDERYIYGGWDPFEGFTLQKNTDIVYPGDAPQRMLAYTHLRDEIIRLYQGSWVMILQKNGSFEISRMD